MNNDHNELWAYWGGMKEASDAHVARIRADQERRRQQARAKTDAEREALRQEQLAEARADMERDSLAYRADGPVCGALGHNSRGTEVTCLLDKGHEEDGLDCDAGNGVTWPHYGD